MEGQRRGGQPGLLSDGVPCAFDVVQGALNGVFHDGHTPAHGVFDELELFQGVNIQFATGALLFFLGLAEDVFAALAGLFQDDVLGDHLLGAVTGAGDDTAGFVLRFTNDAFTLLDDALGLPDFIGKGDPELVDDGEEVLFLNHDPATHGDTFAHADQFFQLIHQVEDIGRTIR